MYSDGYVIHVFTSVMIGIVITTQVLLIMKFGLLKLLLEENGYISTPSSQIKGKTNQFSMQFKEIQVNNMI